MADLDTDALVVGSGPAGSAAALAPATYGVRTTVITKYGRLADTPRAHITNQRTMEALRDLGVEEEVMAEAVPQELMGNLVHCTSIAGEELGRLHAWGTRPDRLEYPSLQQDDDGVTVHVRDRLRGDEYDIRARYVVGADGGRSQIASDIGLPLHGQMGVGGIGAGLVRMVRPWHKWLTVWGYDINGPAPDLTEEYAISIVRKLVGDDSVKVSITSSSAWTVNHMSATADPELMVEHMAARKEATPEAEKQRAALREAIAFKDYEFNCHGVEMDQRYESSAMVPDDTPPERPVRDPELYSHAGRFTVFTGIGGDSWVRAAAVVGERLGIDVASVVIGPGREYDDLYGDRARVRGIDDGGALVVRPDNHVAFRRPSAASDAEAEAALESALRGVLDRAEEVRA